jgi:hypothetical protein
MQNMKEHVKRIQRENINKEFQNILRILGLVIPALRTLVLGTAILATSGSYAAKVCVADGVVNNIYNSWDGSNCSFTNYSYVNGTSGTWTMGSADTACNQVRGESQCATNEGVYAVRGTPAGTSGQYCWCRMTEPRVGAWVFRNDYDSASYCSTDCAGNCADYVRSNADLRAAVLGL